MNEQEPAVTDRVGVPSQLTAAIGLAVAALAAVGLTGSALTRSVRNFPLLVSVILWVVLLSALALAFSGKFPKLAQPAVIVLVVAVCAGVGLGAYSVHQREQPAVLLAGVPEADGSTSVTVTVKGSGLATQDQLDVQVLGLKTFDRLDKIAVSMCEQSYTWSKTNSSGVELDTYLGQQGLATDDATLLSWNRLGPDSDGVVDTSFTLEVPKGAYSGICAFSPLPSDTSEAASNSAAYLRIPADGT
jgi:hypothetical protein